MWSFRECNQYKTDETRGSGKQENAGQEMVKTHWLLNHPEYSNENEAWGVTFWAVHQKPMA